MVFSNVLTIDWLLSGWNHQSISCNTVEYDMADHARDLRVVQYSAFPTVWGEWCVRRYES